MEELTSLVKSLKQNEVRRLRDWYKGTAQNTNTRLQLFNAIRKEKVRTNQEAAQLMYNSSPNSAFTKLKKRLKEDITQIILLQGGNQAYKKTPSAEAQFNCLRNFLAGELLVARGVYEYGEKLLNQAAQTAKDYELTQEQIMIEDYLRGHLGPKKGLEVYQYHEDRIWEAHRLSEGILKARDYYYQLIPASIKSNINTKYQDHTYKATQELEDYYSQTGSARIGYWYYYLRMYFHYVNHRFQKALITSLNMIQLLEVDDTVYTNARLGAAYMQTAAILLHLLRHEESIKYAQQAVEEFQPNMMNELTAKMILFYGYFYTHRLEKAQEVLEAAYEHPKVEENQYLLPKWRYFEANIAYQESRHSDSLFILSENSALLKDKSGWLLGFKLLEILNLIDQGEYDVIDYKLDTLAKLIQRYSDEPLARFKIIFTLLKRLSKHNYNYKKVWETERENIKRLEKSAGNYHWNPLEYELIRFDQWLRSRVQEENPELAKVN